MRKNEMVISYEKPVTGAPESRIPGRVGRKKLYSEDMQARFPEGTFEEISAVLEEGEDRTDFVREAVSRELQRRQKTSSRKGAEKR
jgi:hypothetical protein